MMEDSFNIIKFLKSAVTTGASDEHLITDQPPFIRLNGFIKKTNMQPITVSDMENAILEISPDTMKKDILSLCDLDFMFEIEGCSRFRVNYKRQLGKPSLVIRNISYTIPNVSDLGLPEILENITNEQNGIILVTGPTGSGKSSTIASLINKVNQTSAKHIITIEDPVEFVFECKKSIISQRQVGVDTASFSDGIKYAMRQDPDVIFIGEIRDKETMSAALKAAETGHLVLSTLHTNDAVQTINRIVNMFDDSFRPLIRRQLAENLKATVAQKLVYSQINKKRFPACEIMVVTPTVKDYINKDNTDEIYQLLKENNYDNMISMNQSLADLTNKELISQEEALSYSNDEPELEKIFRGVYQGTKAFYDE